ncbi:MAG: 50S ribosomal protein L19e [Thaumarchaeota archaeon]|jgi:large subunit ribosomal protein L19e|nr:50S ribosomal protein L19e [Candidatus Terraquivivens yellowstonensis]MCL7387180.1 50S ribosomal protein L19e [Candidatus Terraquivivens yellowstonensis]MCL7392348.1 50S ribosomal protein L19e [Candidatus Terraquivivens yellowstonensis]MCL7394845.1 50S ribosomal protein L19e [Candidatus Terraquivivens yellowstonensis]MCL7397727.1 50S ribosomal protein L19e [Candidatus Terraquivivens yellowstonensis]
MSLTLQKRLAAELLKCGESRVRFDEERLDEIEAAISREEIKRLIEDGAIYKIQKKGISKGRLRERKRRKGPGSRKGGKYSIIPRKTQWMLKVRAQRKALKKLRDSKMLVEGAYRKVYKMVKSGAFKSVSAMMEYLKQNKLLRRVFA